MIYNLVEYLCGEAGWPDFLLLTGQSPSHLHKRSIIITIIIPLVTIDICNFKIKYLLILDFQVNWPIASIMLKIFCVCVLV